MATSLEIYEKKCVMRVEFPTTTQCRVSGYMDAFCKSDEVLSILSQKLRLIDGREPNYELIFNIPGNQAKLGFVGWATGPSQAVSQDIAHCRNVLHKRYAGEDLSWRIPRIHMKIERASIWDISCAPSMPKKETEEDSVITVAYRHEPIGIVDLARGTA